MMRKSSATLMRSTLVLCSSWRDQNISYLKYLNVTTETLHTIVKDSKRGKFEKFSIPGYLAQEPDGQGLFQKVNKVPIEIKDY
jgi:hypothetical protein